MSRNPPGTRDEVRARVVALAERQWGHITMRQLEWCGMSRSAISRGVASQRLRRVLPRVYAVGHRSPAPQGRWAAAVLYAGDDTALGGRAAAANLGLAAPPRVVEVIAPRRVTPQRGLRPRWCRSLAPDEVTRVNGVPTTTVARTLLDLAALGDPIARLVANAIARGLITDRALRDYASRHAGARGARALAQAVNGGTTRSAVEREFVAWLQSRGLPLPALNQRVGPLTVDGLWRPAGLAVEIDTYLTHGTPHAFENDRKRDAYLVARGLRTIRVTPDRWRHDGDRLQRDIRAAIARV